MARIETLKPFVEQLIFGIDVDAKRSGSRFGFHLDYDTKTYREKALAGLIRDSVEYFALTHEEFEEYIQKGDLISARRKAWGRISTAHKNKKGDYGELLLFLLLHFRLAERPERFVTKVRLRSARGDQIKGFDCAHFTIENDELCLWLGEAKFHQSFSTAISGAFDSLEEHGKANYLKNEIRILGANIEANHGITPAMHKKLDHILNKGCSLDKMRFKIPVLLTYDSPAVQKHQEICQGFLDDLSKELNAHLDTLAARKINLPSNFTLLFLLMPFHTVATIKSELEKIEKAME